jgi:hypothetical protein
MILAPLVCSDLTRISEGPILLTLEVDSSPVVCEEPVWWSLNAAQESSKKRRATTSQLSSTVSGTADPDNDADVTEEVPEDEVGLFQRPIRRLEDRVGDQSKIDATETGSSDSDNDIFYEAREEAEPEVSEKILTNEARYHSELDAEVANTEAQSIVAEDEPVNTRTAVEGDQPRAPPVDLVERPPSIAHEIIERQPELTPENIVRYDTEDEES